jgi:hypothetical protein
MTNTAKPLHDAPDPLDPAYRAWVEKKIARGKADLEDPGKRIPEGHVRRDFGLED